MALRPTDTESFNSSLTGVESSTENTSAPVRTTRSLLLSSVNFKSSATFGTQPEATPMSLLENLAVNVRPPHHGEVYRKALTASSVVHTLPSGWNTKFITVRAVGEDMQIVFGDSGDTLAITLDAVSSGTPPAMTVNTASGVTIKDGEERNFRISGETQFAVIGATAAGFFELWLSTQADSQ